MPDKSNGHAKIEISSKIWLIETNKIYINKFCHVTNIGIFQFIGIKNKFDKKYKI